MPWRPCPPAAITRYWRPSVTRKVTGVALRFASRPQVEVVREHGMRDMPGEVIQAEKPAAAGAGRARREGPESYWLIRYVRSPLSDLKDSTVNPAFFSAPATKPRTVCFCQPIFSIISASVAPFFRWSMATTWAVLVPSRGPSALGLVAFAGALAAFLDGVAFLGFAVGGALGLPALAALWPLGAFFFGLAPFFEEAFCGATSAPCAATAAADRKSTRL